MLEFIPIFLCILGCFWFIVMQLRRIVNSHLIMVELLKIISVAVNSSTYNFAKYIAADLRTKAKTRDLTIDERDAYEVACKTISDYETMKKQGRA